MRRLRWLQLVFIAVLTFNTTVAAKCPTGSVTVRGRVENLPSTATGAEAMVVIETKNGTVSRTVSLSNGEFIVEVPFSTTSSSFLGTDRCHTVPKVVEVKILSGGKVYVQKRLRFKDSFEMCSLYKYRLKRDLSIDVLKEAASSKQLAFLLA